MNRRLQGFLSSERGEYLLLRAPAAIVLVSALWYVIAFVSMYSKVHAYESASEWIFANIRPGSVIAGVHWDDRLPLSLPGKSAHVFTFEGEEETLNLYEPDSPAKTAQTLRRLAKSDYLVFPTYRIPGSVPRIPEEYPWTTRFIELLFADKLGFKLVQTFKDRPSFLGIEHDDDLADESFTVYDHPKIAVFKNIERLSAAETGERIAGLSRSDGLTLDQLMTRNVENGISVGAATKGGNLDSFLLWFLAIEFLSFAALPLVVFLCRGLVDGGYGLSKIAGIFLFGMFTWWAAAFDVTNFSPIAARTVTVVLAAVSLLAILKSTSIRLACIETVRSNWMLVEGIFLGVSLIFLTVRFFNPEIHWGEKPMDSTFLRFLVRLETLPPEDPWAAGQRMHYYYLGIAFISGLLKLTGIDPAVGFNLAIATLAGLISVGVGSIALSITKSARWTVACAIGVVAVSNLEVIRLRIVDQKPASFDTFWASARVFTSPAFGEYTLWSLLFGDLHAHVIAIPFTVLLIGLFAAFWARTEDRFRWSGIGLRILIGLLFGFLYAANTWDFITFGVIAALIVAGSSYLEFWQPPTHGLSRAPFGERALAFCASKGAALAWDVVLMGGAAATIVLPFAAQSGSTRSIGWGLVQSFELNSLKQVLLFCGHWLLIIVVSSMCIVASRLRRSFSTKAVVWAVLCATYPLVLGAVASANGIEALPWGIITLSSLLILLGMSIAFADRASGSMGILVAGVGIVLVSAELIFLIDRMNTIFKSYMCITLCSAVAALVLWCRASRAIGESETFRGMVFETRLGLHLANTICIVLPLAGTVTDVTGILTMQRVPQRIYTLDGMAYLEKSNPDEFKMVNWLNTHVRGTPVTLEAQGDSYQDYTRIAMHTGLPTVLGWDYHVMQRGTPHGAVEQRRRDVRQMYSTESAESAEELLLSYNVDLIVVGKVERRIYPPAGLAKFEQFPDRFPVLFRDGEAVVYTTRFSSLNPKKGSRTRSIVER